MNIASSLLPLFSSFFDDEKCVRIGKRKGSLKRSGRAFLGRERGRPQLVLGCLKKWGGASSLSFFGVFCMKLIIGKRGWEWLANNDLPFSDEKRRANSLVRTMRK